MVVDQPSKTWVRGEGLLFCFVVFSAGLQLILWHEAVILFFVPRSVDGCVDRAERVLYYDRATEPFVSVSLMSVGPPCARELRWFLLFVDVQIVMLSRLSC